MKIKRNIITILTVMLLSMIMLCGNVNAASSIKASKSKATVGDTVSVTVSFGQKESAAQFRLNYDTSKFDYISCSAGEFVNSRFVYLNIADIADLGSVTLTFRAKALGNGSFSISGVVLSSDNSAISSGSTTVTVEEKKTTTSTNKNTGTKRPTSSGSSNKNQNTTTEEPTEPEVVVKSELDALKKELEEKVQTDYTEESWNALQQVIAAAETATKNSDYDAIKDKLTLDSLVKVEFKKEELDKVLRDLIGKAQTDYTEESWNTLQEAIEIADNVELKSEYDAIKDKLTINELILQERTFLEELMQSPCGHGRIILILAAVIIILVIILIVMIILLCKKKAEVVKPTVGRRLK